MFFEGPNITVEWANVAKQAGGDDCGLFAIAFATSICHNRDPVLVQYKQDKMRAHLLQCFRKAFMEPFPLLRYRTVSGDTRKSHSININDLIL